MKKHLFVTILCACTFLSLCLYSCSQGGTSTQEPATNSKEYTVHLGFSGEITNITTSPLTKATATADSDLYGIQVYSCPATDSISPTYSCYAYGLFDNTSDMTVKLLSGYIYKFVCTMVVDGKDKLYKDGNMFIYPFYLNGGSNYRDSVNDKFIYSTTISMNMLAYGCADVINNNIDTEYGRPNLDRYYGELEDFVPAENKSASISMKRVSFGAKFIAEGLTEGKLKISMADAPDMYITYPDTTAQDIFTFESGGASGGDFGDFTAWTQDSYYETVSTSITWIKSDGATVPLATQDITFKRNKLTTITVKVSDTSINDGINVTTDNTAMGDGGSVTITSGSSTGTNVNP